MQIKFNYRAMETFWTFPNIFRLQIPQYEQGWMYQTPGWSFHLDASRNAPWWPWVSNSLSWGSLTYCLPVMFPSKWNATKTTDRRFLPGWLTFASQSCGKWSNQWRCNHHKTLCSPASVEECTGGVSPTTQSGTACTSLDRLPGNENRGQSLWWSSNLPQMALDGTYSTDQSFSNLICKGMACK